MAHTDLDRIHERRVYRRASIRRSASFRVDRSDGPAAYPARTLNIGAGGALLEIDDAPGIPEGEVRLAVELEGGALAVDGEVVRTDRPRPGIVRLGIRFHRVEAEARRLLLSRVEKLLDSGRHDGLN